MHSGVSPRGLSSLLQKAIRYQRNGQAVEARACYQQLLQAAPDHPDALNLLGVLEYETGNCSAAIPLISRAIQSAPEQPSFFSNLGNVFRGIGRIQKAISCYQKSIALSPDFHAAHHNLAITYRQCGRVKDAETVLRKALAGNPNWTDGWYLLGDILNQNETIDESIACYEKALSINPRLEKAWFFIGNACRLTNDYQKAEACYRRALEIDQHFIECLNNLGLIYAQKGKISEAVDCFTQALEYHPDFAQAHYNLGNAWYRSGKKKKAISCYRHALRMQPDLFEAAVGMGRLHQEDGENKQAIQWYEKAIALQPDSWQVMEQLGNLKRVSGDVQGALDCYDQALEINPDASSVFISMGNTFRMHRRMERAALAFKHAVTLDPESLAALNNLAIALTDIGKSDEAVCIYDRMLAIQDDFATRIKKAMTLPVIYSSATAMLESREAFTTAIERLGKMGGRIKDPYNEIGIANFMLALHGLDEKPIRKMLADFYLAICPQLVWSSPKLRKRKRDQRIRLGIACRFLHNHTIGRLYSGIIEQLDKDRFELFIFRFERQEDAISKAIDRCAREVVVLPQDIFKARERIADTDLDILFYPEIGMDPLTYFIAFSRLAPVQCKRGFQITMGIPTIDHFISSDAAEPPGAQQYYSENLVRLKGTGYYYQRPERPAEIPDRASFGLPEDRVLYVCTQSLFKLHPDFDSVLSATLEKDPRGVLVLLEGLHPVWKEQLLERFKKNIPGIVDRIRFISRQPRDRFMTLHLLADAVIDTIYFSGGHTSLECFAWGVPVVTWPSDLLPGRLTYGFYKRMGLMDCVAQDQAAYVNIAYRLANDLDWRNEVSHRILERSEILFENSEDIKELERFFEHAVEDAYHADPEPHHQTHESNG